ncbi:MAG: FAD:protein FMN transferase [Acidimicrobiales bacterium]
MAPDHEVRRCGRAMGTSYLLVVHDRDERLLDDAERAIADLERRWSRFLADSEISVINRTPGVPVLVSPDTFQVIRAAVDGAIATQGRFDPTVHDSMVSLGYDRTFAQIPAAANPSDAAVAAPGVDGIEFDDALHAVTLPPGVRLDLGGIGKGSAADLVSDDAIRRGAAGIAVSIGGDVRVRGEGPSGRGWSFTDDRGALDLPEVTDGGVCTSTTRRRRWATRSGEVHHILDPATGRPTTNAVESITVMGATAQQAEVLTKAAMVAGDDAEAFLAPFGVQSIIRRRAAA